MSKCGQVGCGVDFTVWLCDGKVWSAGCPQYGQLGHGTDNSYNAADSSVKMVFEPQPSPRMLAALAEKTVTKVGGGVVEWGGGGVVGWWPRGAAGWCGLVVMMGVRDI